MGSGASTVSRPRTRKAASDTARYGVRADLAQRADEHQVVPTEAIGAGPAPPHPGIPRAALSPAAATAVADLSRSTSLCPEQIAAADAVTELQPFTARSDETDASVPDVHERWLPKEAPPLQIESSPSTEAPAVSPDPSSTDLPSSAGQAPPDLFSPLSTIDLGEEAQQRNRSHQSPLAAEARQEDVAALDAHSDPGAASSRPHYATCPPTEMRHMNFATAMAESLARSDDCMSGVSSLVLECAEKPSSARGFHGMLQDGHAQVRTDRDRWFASLASDELRASAGGIPSEAAQLQAGACPPDGAREPQLRAAPGVAARAAA